ncbi:AAA family ATPase [Nocardia sp. NPDC047648]|uniref:AAA family ATPase n=1 Tax=Nocardia sp. NPDC047648 TaxID=3155625 RepID=UPI0033E9C788
MSNTPVPAPAAATAISNPVAARMRAIVEELSHDFLERGEVVRSIVIAMLARQHSFLLGPPGTAKSELSRALTARITGARRWEIQMSKFTSPTKMFGPVDVAALTQGEYRQILDGRATTAHIAFVDEIFKCNLGALNETLSWLNERIYVPESGGDPVVCPLISAVTASNELPVGEESAAIWDRLTVRLVVDYLAQPGNFESLIRSAVRPAAAPAQPTTIDLTELQHAVDVDVPAVMLPDGIIDALRELRSALAGQDIVVSDRRWRQCARLLQASAWLDGRDQVNDNDLAILAHVLWSTLAQRETVQTTLVKMINPDAAEALNAQETIRQLMADLDQKQNTLTPAELARWGVEEALDKLRDLGGQLVTLRQKAADAGRATDTVDSVMAEHAALHERIMRDVLHVPATPVTAGAVR